MAKKTFDGDMNVAGDETNEQDTTSALPTNVREMLPRIDFSPMMERAQLMLQERPGVTLAAAVGTGFFLGVTLFSKVGRMALAGVLGLGAEMVMQKLRAGYLENGAST